MSRSLGLIFFLVASLSMLPMLAFLKIASTSMPLLQMLGIHFITSCLALAPFALKKLKVSKEDRPILLIRVLSGLITFHGVFITAKLLPIGTVSSLLNTSPFFSGIFLWLIMKKNLKWPFWLLITLGFIGVLLILRPVENLSLSGTVLGVFSGMCSGLSMVLSQRLIKKVPPLTISFYALLSGALIHLPLITYWEFSLINLLPVFSGILFVVELYCFTKAFQYLETQRLAPLNYVGVVLSLGLDVIYFRIIPTTLSLAGTSLICLCGTLALYWSKSSLISSLPSKARP